MTEAYPVVFNLSPRKDARADDPGIFFDVAGKYPAGTVFITRLYLSYGNAAYYRVNNRGLGVEAVRSAGHPFFKPLPYLPLHQLKGFFFAVRTDDCFFHK